MFFVLFFADIIRYYDLPFDSTFDTFVSVLTYHFSFLVSQSFFVDIGETDDGGGGSGGSGGSGGARRRSLSGPDPQDLVRYHSLPGAKGVYRRLVKFLLRPVYTVDQVFSSKNQGAPTANKLANLVQVTTTTKI